MVLTNLEVSFLFIHTSNININTDIYFNKPPYLSQQRQLKSTRYQMFVCFIDAEMKMISRPKDK